MKRDQRTRKERDRLAGTGRKERDGMGQAGMGPRGQDRAGWDRQDRTRRGGTGSDGWGRDEQNGTGRHEDEVLGTGGNLLCEDLSRQELPTKIHLRRNVNEDLSRYKDLQNKDMRTKICVGENFLRQRFPMQRSV